MRSSNQSVLTMLAVMAAITPQGLGDAPLYHRGQGRKPQQTETETEQARKIAAAIAKRERRAARATRGTAP